MLEDRNALKEELRAEIEAELKAENAEDAANKTTQKNIALMDGRIITMRPPKLLDLRIASNNAKDEVDQTVTLISNLTGITKKELDNMLLIDFQKLQKAFESFLS